MVHRLKFLLIFAGVFIFSCQAADKRFKAGNNKGTGANSLTTLLRRGTFSMRNVQYAERMGGTNQEGKTVEFYRVTLKNRDVACATRIDDNHVEYTGFVSNRRTKKYDEYNIATFFFELKSAWKQQRDDLDRCFDFKGSLVYPGNLAGVTIKRDYFVRQDSRGVLYSREKYSAWLRESGLKVIASRILQDDGKKGLRTEFKVNTIPPLCLYPNQDYKERATFLTLWNAYRIQNRGSTTKKLAEE